MRVFNSLTVFITFLTSKVFGWYNYKVTVSATPACRLKFTKVDRSDVENVTMQLRVIYSSTYYEASTKPCDSSNFAEATMGYATIKDTVVDIIYNGVEGFERKVITKHIEKNKDCKYVKEQWVWAHTYYCGLELITP